MFRKIYENIRDLTLVMMMTIVKLSAPSSKGLYTLSEAGKLLFPGLSEAAGYQRLRRILAHGDYEIHKSGRTTYLARHELERLGAKIN